MNKLDKIRKLLAMANSPTANTNEADTARQLAESLMAAAGVSEDDIETEATVDPVSTVAVEYGGVDPAAGWYWTAAMAVAHIVGCVTYRDMTQMDANRPGKRLPARMWIGTAEQRATAIELYKWVVAQIERLAEGAKKIAKTQANPRSFLNAYRLGVAQALAHKALEMKAHQAKAAPPVGTALVLQDRVQKAIEVAKNDAFKGYKGVKCQPSHSDRAAFTAGRSAGESVRFHREASGQGQKRLGSG